MYPKVLTKPRVQNITPPLPTATHQALVPPSGKVVLSEYLEPSGCSDARSAILSSFVCPSPRVASSKGVSSAISDNSYSSLVALPERVNAITCDFIGAG